MLYEQFKFFFNLYFLLVALSQFVPQLRIGFLTTYIAPLAFVLTVTMGKEAYDDYKRNLRDKEANSAKYLILEPSSSSSPRSSHDDHLEDEEHDNPDAPMHPSTGPQTRAIPSSKIRVGDLVFLEKNQRVPADMVLLRTSDASGTCFIRTDQLDGETDWKLRVAVPSCQKLRSDRELLRLDAEIYGKLLSFFYEMYIRSIYLKLLVADAPIKDIHTFIGTFSINSPPPERSNVDGVPLGPVPKVEPLTVENVLWSNTVLAAGSAVGLVIYTGSETRAVMNTSHPETKTGLLEIEINRLAKILCAVTFVLSLAMVALNGFRGQWYIYLFRFLILFSSIIPIR